MNESSSDKNKIYEIGAVYGSPRRVGNTDIMLDRLLEGIEECEYFKSGNGKRLKVNRIYVSKMNISPCRECRSCSRDGECIVADEMQDVYPVLMRCDLLAVASPIFFTTVSGYLKAFIDRFQRLWALKYELGRKFKTSAGKKGVLLSCAGSDSENIFDCTKKVMRSFFDVLYIEYYRDFLLNGVDFKNDILKRQYDLDKIFEFGKNGDYLKRGNINNDKL